MKMVAIGGSGLSGKKLVHRLRELARDEEEVVNL